MFAGIWVAFAFLGNSWFQLVLAALLAVVLTQFGFLGHDAAHRQIFASHRWNEWAARVMSGLFTGLSYGWWMSQHNRHHANPNKERTDPDLDPGAIAFTPPSLRAGADWQRLTRGQGYYFFPLLLLEGLALHVASIQTILRREPLKHRWCEAAFVVARIGGYLTVLFVVLPPGKAAAFLGVQMGLFGLLLGGAFAPNHTGMPIVPADVKMDFLRRRSSCRATSEAAGLQTSLSAGSTIRSSITCSPACRDPTCGGRNRSCAHSASEQGQLYGDQPDRCYRVVVRYLNRVGRAARDPFRCPLAAEYRAWGSRRPHTPTPQEPSLTPAALPLPENTGWPQPKETACTS